jgi:hypothetical protein
MRMLNMNITYGRVVDCWIRDRYGNECSDSVIKAMCIVVANVLSSKVEHTYVRRKTSVIASKYNRLKITMTHYKTAVDRLHKDGLVEKYDGKAHLHEELRESAWVKGSGIYKEFDVATQKEMSSSYDDTLQTIILRAKKTKGVSGSDALLGYKDNTNIYSMRKVVIGLNKLNKKHKFTLQGVEMDNSSMVRIFNGAWDKGGRFYRCGVQDVKQRDSNKMPLPIEQTRLGILIDNSPVIEIDFRSLHPLIVYAKDGLDVHKFKGDFYEYIMSCSAFDLKEADRQIIKLGVVIAFNSLDETKAAAALQKEINFNKGVYSFSRGWDVYSLIYKSLEEIQHYFCSAEGTGLHLQYIDSMIAEEVARTFIASGKPLLPVHDSFVVKAEDENKLLEAMCWSFRKVTGNDNIPIGLKIKRWDGSEENYID